MGFFDEDKLHEIMKDIDFSEATGFSKQAQLSMFSDTTLTDDQYAEVAKNVQDLTAQAKKMHENTSKDTDNNYVVLVFKNADDKVNLIENMGIVLDDGRFCNGEDFLAQLYASYENQE